MNIQSFQSKFKFLRILRCFAVATTILMIGCSKQDQKVYPPDQLTIEHSITSNALLVGDQVELMITAVYPTNAVLNVPELGREKEIIQLNRDWQTSLREDGLNQTDVHITLTSFEIGEHTLTTNSITCLLDDSTILTNAFPDITLNVTTSLTESDGTEIADIKAPKKLASRIPRLLLIIVGATLIAFLAGLIVARWMKNRPAKEKAGPPPIPSHILALSALKALQEKQLLEKDECDPFYTELSQILRTYLEGRFNLNAPEETTDEIVEQLSASPELTGMQRNILQEFMRQADMVKFAKGRPDKNTMENAFGTTKRFVNETAQTNLEPNT